METKETTNTPVSAPSGIKEIVYGDQPTKPKFNMTELEFIDEVVKVMGLKKISSEYITFMDSLTRDKAYQNIKTSNAVNITVVVIDANNKTYYRRPSTLTINNLKEKYFDKNELYTDGKALYGFEV